MGAPGMLGNHFDFPPLVRLWFSSFVVPSRVGFRAENAVGALVGFSASLSPNQQAYTKVGQDKEAESRLCISTWPVHIGWGVFIPLTFIT